MELTCYEEREFIGEETTDDPHFEVDDQGVERDLTEYPPSPAKPKHWAVAIAIDGENVLTIESNCYSGIRDVDRHRETIRKAAENLLAFIGDGDSEFIIPNDE